MNFWLVGNLGRIDYVNDNEYDLFIRPDTCCPRFRCWFLFTVENVKADQVRRKTKKIFDFIGKCLRLFRELFSILWIFPKRNLCIETVWHLWWNQPVENDGKSGLAIDWIIIRWNFLFSGNVYQREMFSTTVVLIIERIMSCHLPSVSIEKMMSINLHILFHIPTRNFKIISRISINDNWITFNVDHSCTVW